jgi:hypothetical protein
MAFLKCITISILGCSVNVSMNDMDRLEPQCPFKRVTGSLETPTACPMAV